LPGQPFRIAFFGQLVFHKGWDVFLKAAEEYVRLKALAEQSGRKFPEVRFSIYGTRQLSDELTQRLDRLIESTSSVVYDHGPYEMDSMQDLLSRLHCVVVPSIWWENSPLVIQETFMAGLPVICSNIGGMAEKVKDRVNGLHFAVGDHFDLLNKILELAVSPQLCNRFSQAVPKIMSDRDMANQISSLYDGLLQKYGKIAVAGKQALSATRRSKAAQTIPKRRSRSTGSASLKKQHGGAPIARKKS